MNNKTILMALASALCAGFAGAATLTWNGGATGTWDDTTANWLDESNAAVAWTDGAVAAFTSACDITLAKDVTVASLSIKGGDFTLSGENVLAFSGNATVSLGGVTANIACPVYANGTLTTERLNTQTTVAGLTDVYLSTNEWRKIAEGFDVSMVKIFSLVAHCDGWIAAKNSNSGAWSGEKTDFTISTDGTLAEHRVRILEQTSDSITAMLIHNLHDWGGTWAAMVFEIQDRDDGLYAKVLKCKAFGTKDNDPLTAEVLSRSYDELDLNAIYSDDAGNKRIGEFLIYDDAAWTADTKPKTWKGDKYTIEEGFMPGGAVGDYKNFSFVVDNPASLTFSGNVLTAGDITLAGDAPIVFAGHLADTTSANVSSTVEAGVAYLKGSAFNAVFAKALTSSAKGTAFAMKGQILSGRIKTTGSGTIDVAATAELVLKYGTDSGTNHSAHWRISGTVDVQTLFAFSQKADAGNNSTYSEVLSGGKMIISWAAENRMLGDQPIYVRDGGLVVVRNAAYNKYGNLEKTLIVEKGGVYSNAFVSAGSDGRAEKDVCRIVKIDLRGGRYDGVSFWAGYQNYGARADTLLVSGSSPSTMAAGYFVIESTGEINDYGGFAGADVSVADVTSDDQSDFILESEIVRKSNASAINEKSRWGYGFVKTGAGTMELRKVSTFGLLPDGTFGGTTMLSNGTIRIAKSASGCQLGFLHLGGDAALQLDAGATVNFAPSTNVTLYANNASVTYQLGWNPDATLTLKSKVAPKSIRFGTDANGLTADQLAQIKYARSVTTRKNVVFSLDKDGYLKDSLSGGLIIVIQ